MDSTFTTDDKELVLQFLTVLHGWVQDTKKEKEKDLEVLQLQEGVIKLLFARLVGGDNLTPEDIIESADAIFDAATTPTEEEPPTDESPSVDKEGKVIEIASWIRDGIRNDEE